MKKIFFILTLVLVSTFHVYAQDEGNDNPIRDRMREFIQNRLNLSKTEAEQFTPVFIRYFREWRTAIKENQGDVLKMQQRIIDIRLRYRDEFRGIIGEQRSNAVYKHQDVFMQELKTLRQERRMEERNMPLKRNR